MDQDRSGIEHLVQLTREGRLQWKAQEGGFQAELQMPRGRFRFELRKTLSGNALYVYNERGSLLEVITPLELNMGIGAAAKLAKALAALMREVKTIVRNTD